MKKLIYLVLFLSCFSCLYGIKKDPPVRYNTDSKTVTDLCFSDKGTVLALTDEKNIKIFSTRKGELLREFVHGHRSSVLAIDLSADSAMLVSGGKDSTIVIWDLVTGKILQSLSFHKAVITSVQFSPDSRFLLSGDSDGKVILYDLEQGVVVREINDYKRDIAAVKFSHDGKLFATAGGDKMIRIYETGNLKPGSILEGHKNWVRDISFSFDGTKLISCGDDSKVYLWSIGDLQKTEKKKVSGSLFNWITGVDFNTDNLSYAYCTFNGTVWIASPFDRYRIRIKGAANKIRFKPEGGTNLVAVVTTMNDGAMLVDAKNMKMKKF